MLREPKLGVACGKKGVGKTFATGGIIADYVNGRPSEGQSPNNINFYADMEN